MDEYLRCGRNEFRCDYGACINKRYQCNGFKNCGDGSDETRELCSRSRRRKCTRYHFQCKYGACIHKKKKCDGRPNCADASDEDPVLCGWNHTDSITRASTILKTTSSESTSQNNPKTGSKIDTTTEVFVKTSQNTSMWLEESTVPSVAPLVSSDILKNHILSPVKSFSSQNPPFVSDRTLSAEKHTFLYVKTPVTSQIPPLPLDNNPVSNENISLELDKSSEPAIEDNHLNITEIYEADNKDNLTNIFLENPDTDPVVPADQNQTESGKMAGLLCSFEKSTGVLADIISCDTFDQAMKIMEIPDKYHRTINRYGPCETPDGVVPSTLVYVDCWGKYSGMYECKVNGHWHALSSQTTVTVTEKLCQFEHLNPPVCGRSPRVRKSQSDYSWPFLVSLRDEGEYSCIGSIINARFVITAAHCVYDEYRRHQSRRGPDYYRILVEFPSSDQSTETAQISEIFIHPDFSLYDGLRDDVALLKLAKSLTFSERVSPACLSDTENIYAPIAATFQRNHGNQQRWMVLTHTINVDCFNKESRCTRHLSLSNDQFCARNVDSTEQLTRGDSGGPYLVNTRSDHDEKWTVSGLLSHVVHTSECDSQSVFITLHTKWEWIRNCLMNNICRTK